MNAISNSLLGIAFLGVGAAATFLMYHLWGYPYDKEKLYSFAPRGLIRLHRLLGYVYLILYVYFLVQMSRVSGTTKSSSRLARSSTSRLAWSSA
jgi:hypothetical protein